MPSRKPGRLVPEGVVRDKHGFEGFFHFEHYLKAINTDAFVADQFGKAWLSGALIMLGDELSKHSYFNHQPELEVIYHVRNGLAHGNRFSFTANGRRRLQKFPAHTRAVINKNTLAPPLVIEESLHGEEVLFHFLAAGDVVNLLQSVGFYCREWGYGTVGYRET